MSRDCCHLCDDAVVLLKRLGIEFETIDVDSDPELTRRYGERVPVLLADGVEVASAPIEAKKLRESLAALRT
jgi:glutaredoxin